MNGSASYSSYKGSYKGMVLKYKRYFNFLLSVNAFETLEEKKQPCQISVPLPTLSNKNYNVVVWKEVPSLEHGFYENVCAIL